MYVGLSIPIPDVCGNICLSVLSDQSRLFSVLLLWSYGTVWRGFLQPSWTTPLWVLFRSLLRELLTSTSLGVACQYIRYPWLFVSVLIGNIRLETSSILGLAWLGLAWLGLQYKRLGVLLYALCPQYERFSEGRYARSYSYLNFCSESSKTQSIANWKSWGVEIADLQIYLFLTVQQKDLERHYNCIVIRLFVRSQCWAHS